MLWHLGFGVGVASRMVSLTTDFFYSGERTKRVEPTSEGRHGQRRIALEIRCTLLYVPHGFESILFFLQQD